MADKPKGRIDVGDVNDCQRAAVPDPPPCGCKRRGGRCHPRWPDRTGGAEFRLPLLIGIFAVFPHRAIRTNLLDLARHACDGGGGASRSARLQQCGRLPRRNFRHAGGRRHSGMGRGRIARTHSERAHHGRDRDPASRDRCFAGWRDFASWRCVVSRRARLGASHSSSDRCWSGRRRDFKSPGRCWRRVHNPDPEFSSSVSTSERQARQAFSSAFP